MIRSMSIIAFIVMASISIDVFAGVNDHPQASAYSQEFKNLRKSSAILRYVWKVDDSLYSEYSNKCLDANYYDMDDFNRCIEHARNKTDMRTKIEAGYSEAEAKEKHAEHLLVLMEAGFSKEDLWEIVPCVSTSGPDWFENIHDDWYDTYSSEAQLKHSEVWLKKCK